MGVHEGPISPSATRAEWADFYSTMGSNYEDAFAHDAGLLEFIPKALAYIPAGSTILDTGSGTGKPVAVTLASAGHSVIGIDISDDMLSLAKAAVPEPQARFEKADMRTWEKPLNVKLQGVFAIRSLFALDREDIELVVHRWGQMLEDNGVLCASTIAAEDVFKDTGGSWDDDGQNCARDMIFRFMGQDVSVTLFSRQGWQWLLEKEGFQVIDIFEHTFHPPKEADSDVEPNFIFIARKK